MSMGKGYHRESERRLHEITVREGHAAPIVTSAGALVAGLTALGAKTVALVAPYLKPLTRLVIDYVEAEGISVADSISLEISDNLEVGRRDPMALLGIYRDLKLSGIDALILSSCVQMPSLAAVPVAENQCGLPVSLCVHLYHLPDVEMPRPEDIRARRGCASLRKILAVIFLA
jgi:maleate isomerase